MWRRLLGVALGASLAGLVCATLPAWAAPAELVAEAAGDRGAFSEAPRTMVVAQATLDQSRQLAATVARLGQLEDEVRRLRGRVEELEYKQRQQDAAREGVGPPPSVAAGTGSAAAAPSATSAPAATRPAPAQGTLGTVRQLPPAQAPGTSAAPAQVARVDPNAPSREQYEAALQLLQGGDWPEAQSAFEGFVKRFPKDPLAANAAYWLGETFYIRKDYSSAAAAFARNYRTYGPDAAKAPDNLLKLGMSLSALGDKERACQTFTELGRRYENAAAPVKQSLVRERASAGCG